MMMVTLLSLKFTLECPFLPCAAGLGDPASPAVRTRRADAPAPVPGPTPHISGAGGVAGHAWVPLCCFWATLLPAVLVMVPTSPALCPRAGPGAWHHSGSSFVQDAGWAQPVETRGWEEWEARAFVSSHLLPDSLQFWEWLHSSALKGCSSTDPSPRPFRPGLL